MTFQHHDAFGTCCLVIDFEEKWVRNGPSLAHMCRAKLTDRTPTSLIIARAKRTLCMRHVGRDTDSNFRGRRDLAINRMSPCSPHASTGIAIIPAIYEFNIPAPCIRPIIRNWCMHEQKH